MPKSKTAPPARIAIVIRDFETLFSVMGTSVLTVPAEVATDEFLKKISAIGKELNQHVMSMPVQDCKTAAEVEAFFDDMLADWDEDEDED